MASALSAHTPAGAPYSMTPPSTGTIAADLIRYSSATPARSSVAHALISSTYTGLRVRIASATGESPPTLKDVVLDTSAKESLRPAALSALR